MHAAGVQAGLQGTNRPALYHVLLDEANFKATDIQMLTYKCDSQYLGLSA